MNDTALAQTHHERATDLALDLMEQLNAEGLSDHEAIYGVLVVAMRAAIDLAPSTIAATGMIGAALTTASERE